MGRLLAQCCGPPFDRPIRSKDLGANAPSQDRALSGAGSFSAPCPFPIHVTRLHGAFSRSQAHRQQAPAILQRHSAVKELVSAV